MLKRLVIRIINSLFGLNLTEGDFDAFISFIKMLIGIFGSVSNAVAYVTKVNRQVSTLDPDKARAIFEQTERTLAEA